MNRRSSAVKVLTTVLGGGMAGRLFAELRDKQALAYTASAFFDPVRDPGALIVYLGTAPDNAARTEEALRKEIERIRSEPVGAEELQRAKGYLLGNYEMDRRTNGLWLTADGRALAARLRRRIERHERRFAARLSEAERSQLLFLLGKLAQ